LNHTIHSTTKKTPIGIFLGRIPKITAEELKRVRTENIEKVKEKQRKDLEYHNRTRNPLNKYKK